MSRKKIINRLAVLAVSAFFVLALSGSASAADKYVALGDSYSTGTLTGGWSLSLTCGRSTNGYPYLIDKGRANTDLDFRACDGAVTGDIPGQAAAINSDTDIVTITVGGNDIGFANLVASCLTLFCDFAIADATDKVNNVLPGQLDNAYGSIKSRVSSTAKVVVLGYGRFFGSKTCTLGASSSEQTKLNALTDKLDAVIAARAAAYGFTYKSSLASFTGHDVCASDNWLSNATWHPTKNGHSRGLAPAVRSVIG